MDIREIFSGPKLEPVLPKQNRPKPNIKRNPDIRDLLSGPDNSFISRLHCTYTIRRSRGPRGRSGAFVCGLSSPVLGLHSVGRLTSERFCQVCLGTGDFLRPQGAIPPSFYPIQWGGYCLAPEGNADGAEGIFGLAGRVWASALRPGSP